MSDSGLIASGQNQWRLLLDSSSPSFITQTMWFVEQLLEYSRNVSEVIHGESKYLYSSTHTLTPARTHAHHRLVKLALLYAS